MFDCHFDLLTYIYINRNDLKKIKEYTEKIFKNDITGGIFTLFYMSEKEMKDELGIEKNEIDIISNLECVNKLIKENNLIPKNITYCFGIEGLDYLKSIEDIDKIYNLGVRSVNIVWNNDNKFAGGIKGNKNRGLTNLGIDLVKKLVSKNIAIDLSHANEKTFFDIINLCTILKVEGKNPKVFVSHSNCKSICKHQRNLSDSEILEIKKINGIIGVVGVKPFCIYEEKFNNNRIKYEKKYIEHIKYLKKLLGGVENISVSTDDMTNYKSNKNYYKHFNVFKQNKMKKRLEKLLLKNGFTKKEIQKILYKNAEDFLDIF